MKNLLAVPRGYFDRVLKPSLAEKKEGASPLVKEYAIAGKSVRVYLYGEHVARVLTLALAHLEKKGNGEPELSIHAWDSSGNKNKVTAPWDDVDYKKNEILNAESFLGVYIGGEESLNFYDKENKTAYFWTEDAAQLPDWVLGAPFRAILHWFLSDKGIHLIHGAVVGEENVSVLLTAKSGSGKSTSALSCVLAGMDYLGDDYVAIESKGDVKVHSLYQSAKVTKDGLDLLPEFSKNVWNEGFGEREKAVLFLKDVFPEQIKKESRIAAVFIPCISSGETRMVPASKIEAMLALAPTTLFQLPLSETRKIEMFKSILEKIPCYFLYLGREMKDTPKVIRDFLKNK